MNKQEILELLDNCKPELEQRVGVCASKSFSARVRWRMAKPA